MDVLNHDLPRGKVEFPDDSLPEGERVRAVTVQALVVDSHVLALVLVEPAGVVLVLEPPLILQQRPGLRVEPQEDLPRLARRGRAVVVLVVPLRLLGRGALAVRGGLVHRRAPGG